GILRQRQNALRHHHRCSTPSARYRPKAACNTEQSDGGRDGQSDSIHLINALYDLRYSRNKHADAWPGLLLHEGLRMAIGGTVARRQQAGCDRGASYLQLGSAGPVERGLRVKNQSLLAGKTFAVPMAVRLSVQMDGRHSSVSVGVPECGGAVGG